MKAPRHSGRVTLLLPALEAVDELPDDQVPAVLTHLGALLVGLAARQATRRCVEPVEDDLLDIDEAAKLTLRSPSWLHHHGHELAGFRQPHGKGGRKFWSRRALMAWITRGEGAC